MSNVLVYALIDENGNVLAMSQKQSYVKMKQKKEFPHGELVELGVINEISIPFEQAGEIVDNMSLTGEGMTQLSLFERQDLYTTNEEGIG